MRVLPPVYVTYGWCRVSYVILDSLARRGVEVHAGDASRLAMCRYSRRCASFSTYRNPYRDPEGFVDDVAAAMARTGARVLIPGHEDVLPIARSRDRLPADVRLVAPDADVIALANNKWRLLGLARDAGVPVPDTAKPETPDELRAVARDWRYPAIVKTELGNSAKGVVVVGDPTECVDAFEKLVRRYRLPGNRWPMIQTFARGTGYGVCLLYNHGALRASFCERYIRCKDGQVGTSVFRESVHAPVLEGYARALLEGLKWHGVAHVDFLYDEPTGQAAVIEINPRFWGALDLAVRAGVDFPWLLYRMAVDGDVDPVTSYRTGVRSQWIVGELLHLANHARRRRWRALGAAVHALWQTRADGHDDFRRSDPLPLAAEVAYYGTRFLATGSVNPVEEGMVG